MRTKALIYSCKEIINNTCIISFFKIIMEYQLDSVCNARYLFFLSVSYSEDLSIATVGKSVFDSLVASSGPTIELEVQCCENGVLSSTIQTCGGAVSCGDVCGENTSGEHQ